MPKAEVHVPDEGHFALDTAADQTAQLVRGFMEWAANAAAAHFGMVIVHTRVATISSQEPRLT